MFWAPTVFRIPQEGHPLPGQAVPAVDSRREVGTIATFAVSQAATDRPAFDGVEISIGEGAAPVEVGTLGESKAILDHDILPGQAVVVLLPPAGRRRIAGFGCHRGLGDAVAPLVADHLVLRQRNGADGGPVGRVPLAGQGVDGVAVVTLYGGTFFPLRAFFFVLFLLDFPQDFLQLFTGDGLALRESLHGGGFRFRDGGRRIDDLFID